jgi:hypothetical protein
MMRARPLAAGALPLAVLAVLAATGTGVAAPHADATSALAVYGSVSASGLPPPSDEYSVTLTYTLSNQSSLPILGITWHGELYRVADTTASTGSMLMPFDCELRNDDLGALLDSHGLLVLLSGAAATCTATMDLPPGSYTASLTVHGYALLDPAPRDPASPEPRNAAPGTPPQSPANQPCPGVLDCLPLPPVSARSDVPFTLLTPPNIPPTPRPSSPSPSPSRSAIVTSPATSAPPASTASQAPTPSHNPSHNPRLSLSQSPTPSPSPGIPLVLATPDWSRSLLVGTEVPTPLFILIMIVPAVAVGAALLGRRR